MKQGALRLTAILGAGASAPRKGEAWKSRPPHPFHETRTKIKFSAEFSEKNYEIEGFSSIP